MTKIASYRNANPDLNFRDSMMHKISKKSNSQANTNAKLDANAGGP